MLFAYTGDVVCLYWLCCLPILVMLFAYTGDVGYLVMLFAYTGNVVCLYW